MDSEREKQLLIIKDTSLPAVVFESKHRIVSLLRDIADTLGPDIQIAVMRELTKLHEEIYHDTASNLLEQFSENILSGEITMIIGVPPSHSIKMNNFDKQIIELSKKHSASEIVSIIRLFNDVNKKELYKYVLKIRQSG